MSKDIIDKVNKEEWYRAKHAAELIYTIIDSHLVQSPISKLDKDISKHIEEAANSMYKATILIDNNLRKNEE